MANTIWSFILDLLMLVITLPVFFVRLWNATRRSKFIVIGGSQGGDEGKGKVTNYLTHKAVKAVGASNVIVLGVNGGSNAGHTTSIRGKDYHTHFFPSGVLEEGVVSYCGSNKVLNPRSLMREINDLSQDFPNLLNYVWFSDRIHVTLIPHIILDSGKMGQSIGTTGQGVGQTYMTKASRKGLRLADLLVLNEDQLRGRLMELYESMGMDHLPKGKTLYSYKTLTGETINVDYDRLFSFEDDLVNIRWIIETLGRRIVSSGFFKKELLKQRGKYYIFELSHALLLDTTFGTYPNVTSSSCITSAIFESCGLNIQDVFDYDFKNCFESVGVAKAYPTRVGNGVLPTLMIGDDAQIEEAIITNGGERGVTTGRRRRAGWIDMCMLRYSATVNGFKSWNLTRGDNMVNCDKVKLCVGYKYPDETVRLASDFFDYPATEQQLSSIRPVYIEIDGWKGFDFSKVKSYGQLHPNFRKYLRLIKHYTGVPVKYVNTGRDQSQLIEI